MQKTTPVVPEALSKGLQKILENVPDENTFWSNILYAINDPLFIVDENKEIVFFNKKAEEVTGFSAEEVLGKPCITGVRCVNCLHECALFNDGEVRFKNLEFVKKDGETIKVVKNAAVFTDGSGKVIGGVETFRDVTDRLAIEEQRAREKQMLEQVLNGIGDGVITVDEHCMIDFANERVAAVCGYKATKMIGKPVSDFFEPGICSRLGDPALHEKINTTIQTREGAECAVQLRILPFEKSGEKNGRLILFRQVSPSERVRQRLEEGHHYHGLISASPLMIEIFNLVESISDSDVSVLIEGESGTGKETIARTIHDSSPRQDKPFSVVNCAVLDDNVLESELFGHAAGAFPGATSDKIGRFELANGGTVFLDEIGELSPVLQAKLVRMVQAQEFERTGEIKTRSADVRIIAANTTSLLSRVESGDFRADLYYRLSVIPISVPPLRKRIDDIPLLAEHFIEKTCQQRRIAPLQSTDDAMLLLQRHQWSGNVRELENALLHAIACSENKRISVANLPRTIRLADAESESSSPAVTVEDEEKKMILEAMRSNGFSRAKAAEVLGITRTTLWRKMKRYRMLP